MQACKSDSEFLIHVVHCIYFLLNFVGAIFYFGGTISNATQSTTSGITMGVTVIILIVLAPLTYLCWFRPVYAAFKYSTFLLSFSILALAV